MFKIQNGQRYVCRNGDIVEASTNTDGWFDGLPFICTVVQWASIAGGIGLGGAPKYTCDERGRVYPPPTNRECSQDLVRKAHILEKVS